MSEILTLQVTSFEQNARVITGSRSKRAAVIDPGGDTEKILSTLEEGSLICEQIWLTHSHLDHCGGVKRLKAATGAKLYAHPAEADMRAAVEDYSALFGIGRGELENCPEPDVPLSGGEDLSIGDRHFKVIHAPGHSPGSLCYYDSVEKLVIVGDVLFMGSIGRTDLPGGNHQQLLKSIKLLMDSLPPETRVLCGHGPDTSLRREKEKNPFLQGDSV